MSVLGTRSHHGEYKDKTVKDTRQKQRCDVAGLKASETKRSKRWRGGRKRRRSNRKREVENKWGKNKMKQYRPETRPHETKGRSEFVGKEERRNNGFPKPENRLCRHRVGCRFLQLLSRVEARVALPGLPKRGHTVTSSAPSCVRM